MVHSKSSKTISDHVTYFVATHVKCELKRGLNAAAH